MKKFLLLGSVVLCAMSMAANTPAVRFVNIGKKHLPEAVVKSRAAVKAASQTRIWRPAKYTEYYWEITNPETWAGDWKGSGTTVCTYNMAGQVTSKVNDYVKQVYEYDAEGRCILSASFSNENGTFIPGHKTEFAYDDIVKNLVIDEKFYYYRENKWNLEESYRTVVTRNADGNITQIKAQMSRPGSQDWQDETLVEVGYGSDKKANAIKAYGYEEGKMEIEFELVDVIWDRTDGQIVIGNYGDD